MKTIGAFIFADVWQAWSDDDAREFLTQLKAFGVNAIFTESDTYRHDIIDLAHALDMRFIGGISCFSNNQHVQENPDLRPITEDGQPRQQMEWYIGITPGHESYAEQRLAVLENILSEYDLDGVWLDFVRWSIHWELELRPNAPRPLQSSFDPHTLARFSQAASITIPDHLQSAASQAQWILSAHGDRWVQFKCDVITDFVQQAHQRTQAHDTPLGIFLIPGSDSERRAYAGQDVAALIPHTEVISPMLYHRIVHRPVSWISDFISELSAAVPAQNLLPVLQVDSEQGEQEGYDWGGIMPPDEWRQAINAGLTDNTSGLIAFTGSALFTDTRGQILAEI